MYLQTHHGAWQCAPTSHEIMSEEGYLKAKIPATNALHPTPAKGCIDEITSEVSSQELHQLFKNFQRISRNNLFCLGLVFL